MKITAIKRQKGKRDRLNVYVDGEYRLAVAEEIALRAGVRAGSDCDEALLASLADGDLAWRTRESALALLTYRPRSTYELRQRLLRKQLPPDAIDRCIDQLTRASLLDDGAFARSFARDRIRTRPKAPTALLAELRAKGVAPEVASEAIRDVLEENAADDIDLARRAAHKFRRRSGEEPLRARRRLYGFLARRGFGADAIRQVIDEQEW